MRKLNINGNLVAPVKSEKSSKTKLFFNDMLSVPDNKNTCRTEKFEDVLTSPHSWTMQIPYVIMGTVLLERKIHVVHQKRLWLKITHIQKQRLILMICINKSTVCGQLAISI